MPYFSTPPFWGGAEDYGASKETLPLPRPKFRAPAFGKDREAMVPVMDEAAPPPLSAPIEGPTPLSEPKTPAWTTSDEIRETLKNQPKLERAKGWKGVLQAIGDAVVNPELMHPKYAQQARDYEQKMGRLTALKKLEDQDAEQERRRMVAEAQMSADRSTEAFRNKQIADLDRPAGPRPLMNTKYGPFDPNKNEYLKPPDWANGDGKETPAEAKARRQADADELKLTGTARTSYILTGKIPNERRGGGGERGVPPSAFLGVKNAKSRALLEVERNAQTRVNELRNTADRRFWYKADSGKTGPDPALIQPEIDRVYADLRREKQQIQNNYEEGVETLGGTVTHYEYPSGTATANTAPPPPPPAVGGKVKMLAPDGQTVKEIDNDPALIKHYESLGAKRL